MLRKHVLNKQETSENLGVSRHVPLTLEIIGYIRRIPGLGITARYLRRDIAKFISGNLNSNLPGNAGSNETLKFIEMMGQ